MKRVLIPLALLAVFVFVTLALPFEPRPRSDFRAPPEPTAVDGRWQPPTPVICYQPLYTPVPGAGRICLPPHYGEQ